MWAAKDHDFESYKWEPERCGYVDDTDMMCGFKEDKHLNLANDFLVGSQGMQTVVIGGAMATYPMDSAKALRLAAWLVVIAEVNREMNHETGPTFEETLDAVRRT